MHRVRSLRLGVIPVAFTGIAASLLDGGQTIHSRFRLPIPTESDSISNIKTNTLEAQKLKYSRILVMDEASSISKHVYSCVDRFFRDIRRQPNVPFGGIVVLLTGDFRQTLPVPDMSRITQSVELCLKRSPLWQYFRRLRLVQNMRALAHEVEFKEWLMRVGDGVEPTIDGQSLIRIPDRILVNDNIVDRVFGEGLITTEFLRTTNLAILCPTNKDSLEINEVVLNKVEGNYNLLF